MNQEHQVIIHYLNYATLQIECETDIALELSETFKFLADGYKYSPKYNNGSWDGFIRLFNLGSHTIGSGLLNRIITFCVSREYTYAVVGVSGDSRVCLTVKDTTDYIDSLNLHARGEPLPVRDYQIKGVQTMLNERSAIINAATGSGKSLILYSVTRYITEVLSGRVLIIVPTVSLTTQLHSDFKDYSSHSDFDMSSIHLISAGADKTVNSKIVISTFQSLAKISKDWINSFMAIITDEGHKITADSFKNIYSVAVNVPYRLACTGTVHDTKCSLLQMEAITGPVFEIALAKDLIEAGQLVPLKVKAISLNYAPDICKQFKKVEYINELNWLFTNPKRNFFIKNLAIKCKGTTLVLFRFIEQGKLLYNAIKDASSDRPVYYIDGTVKKETREVFRIAGNNEDSIIVASYACFSTGINLPAIENIIIGAPIKSKLSYLQTLGRGLRLKEGKEFCNLFDIGDNLSHRSHVNTTYSHFGDRLEMLTREGHEFTIVNVDFK